MSEFLYGKRPILETLRARRRRVSRLFFATPPQDPEAQSLMTLGQEQGVPGQQMPKKWFEDKFPGSLTQGWAAEVSPYPYSALEELLQKLESKDEGTLLALDQIQDPQNLGAILRSAECSGVDAVVLPIDRSAAVTAAVSKAAAGAEEHLQIIQVTNLSRAIAAMKERGYWAVGTAFPGPELKVSDALEFEWPAKTLLILGAEGKGMRRLTREGCDFLLHLPLLGKISSLNVSAAAAIFLYQVLKSRRISKK